MINHSKHERTLIWFKNTYNSQAIFSTELYNDMLELIEDQRAEIVRLKRKSIKQVNLIRRMKGV